MCLSILVCEFYNYIGQMIKSPSEYANLVFLSPRIQPLPSPYVHSGFMELQRALEESIIEYYANQTDRAVPEIELKMKVCVLLYVLCAKLIGGWHSDVTSTHIRIREPEPA